MRLWEVRQVILLVAAGGWFAARPAGTEDIH